MVKRLEIHIVEQIDMGVIPVVNLLELSIGTNGFEKLVYALQEPD